MKQASPLKNAVYRETLATLKVIDQLVELEKTKGYLKSSSSLYALMTVQLRYSEGAAMRRIHAARLILKLPEVRELLRIRKLSLCTLSMIATEVLRTGDRSLIQRIQGKSKSEVKSLLAFEGSTNPMREQVRVIAPPVSPVVAVRKVEAKVDSTATGLSSPVQAPPPVKPLYRMSFTATEEVHQLMEEVKAGMAHTLRGKKDVIAQLFEAGVRLLHKEIQKRRTRKIDEAPPRGEGRYVPVELRRAVFERDDCKCQYRYEDGSICGSDWSLELDHIDPVALGGRTELSNLRVACSTHNKLLAQEAGLTWKGADSACER